MLLLAEGASREIRREGEDGGNVFLLLRRRCQSLGINGDNLGLEGLNSVCVHKPHEENRALVFFLQLERLISTVTLKTLNLCHKV